MSMSLMSIEKIEILTLQLQLHVVKSQFKFFQEQPHHDQDYKYVKIETKDIFFQKKFCS